MEGNSFLFLNQLTTFKMLTRVCFKSFMNPWRAKYSKKRCVTCANYFYLLLFNREIRSYVIIREGAYLNSVSQAFWYEGSLECLALLLKQNPCQRRVVPRLDQTDTEMGHFKLAHFSSAPITWNNIITAFVCMSEGRRTVLSSLVIQCIFSFFYKI